jgi:hypothetical protein
MGNGLIGKIYQWIASPGNSDTNIQFWMMGLGLVLVLAFLWSTVVRDVLGEVKTLA